MIQAYTLCITQPDKMLAAAGRPSLPLHWLQHFKKEVGMCMYQCMLVCSCTQVRVPSPLLASYTGYDICPKMYAPPAHPRACNHGIGSSAPSNLHHGTGDVHHPCRRALLTCYHGAAEVRVYAVLPSRGGQHTTLDLIVCCALGSREDGRAELHQGQALVCLGPCHMQHRWAACHASLCVLRTNVSSATDMVVRIGKQANSRYGHC